MRAKIQYDITVIVPVFNDWEKCLECLDALGKQTFSLERYEVIVVDNGSVSVPKLQTYPFRISLLSCKIPGSYAARNIAVERASGLVLAFTDADCLADKNWLTNGWSYISAQPDAVGIVSGRVAVKVNQASSLWKSALQLHDAALAFQQDRYAKRGYGLTANLFIRRDLFDIIGLFNEKRLSGGDAEYCFRAKNAGIQLSHCADALVYHPARDSFTALAKKSRRVAGGRVRHGEYRRRVRGLLLATLPPVMPLARLAKYPHAPMKVKLCAFLIVLGLWPIRFSEMVRVLLGGTARRA